MPHFAATPRRAACAASSSSRRCSRCAPSPAPSLPSRRSAPHHHATQSLRINLLCLTTLCDLSSPPGRHRLAAFVSTPRPRLTAPQAPQQCAAVPEQARRSLFAPWLSLMHPSARRISRSSSGTTTPHGCRSPPPTCVHPLAPWMKLCCRFNAISPRVLTSVQSALLVRCQNPSGNATGPSQLSLACASLLALAPSLTSCAQ